MTLKKHVKLQSSSIKYLFQKTEERQLWIGKKNGLKMVNMIMVRGAQPGGIVIVHQSNNNTTIRILELEL